MADLKLTVKKIVSVLIIDDHKMVRDGLKMMLASLKTFIHFKVQEAESGEDAITIIDRMEFDIAIVDYQLTGISGPETINQILKYKPNIRILALSNYDELSYIQSMIDAGACGYILKNIEPAEMLNAIKTILSGKIYYCNEVAVKLIESVEEKNTKKIPEKRILTRRQTEILQLIYQEMNSEEIAQKLFISKRTVESHRQNIMVRLDVKNTVGLMKKAIRLKLVEV